jgi:hypothetical protein
VAEYPKLQEYENTMKRYRHREKEKAETKQKTRTIRKYGWMRGW